MINGKKEGKWCEYINFNDVLTTVPHEPDQGYQLTIYKAGAPIGLVKQFYTSGKLWDIVYYVNGQRSGIEKMYYESGELKSEITNADGVPLIIKDFYKNGKLKSEQIFSLGKSSTKHYDESGNEIKQ
jgi:antitoxin component YwqK of YwqJK toxin-antitoxin module